MGDITKGRTFQPGNIIVAAAGDEGINKVSLNEHADQAVINPSFVSAKPEDLEPDGAADFVLTYDASAAALKKVKIQKLPGGQFLPSPAFVILATTTTPSIACDANKVSQNFAMVMPNGGDATLTITGLANGMQGMLYIVEGNTTPRDLYLPGISYIPGFGSAGSGPAQLQKVINRGTMCLWIYNGNNLYWSFVGY